MKKQIALLIAIMMLVGVMGTVPAFAATAEWTPISSDDGYTKQLADYDMTETVSTPGIMGAKLIKDEGFDGTAIDTTQLTKDDAGTYSIVSATEEEVKDADAHGNVLKQVGQNKTDYATSQVKQTNLWTADGVVNNVKKVVAQVDVNVGTRPPSTGYIDVLKVTHNSGAAQTIRFIPKPNGGKCYIQVCKDGNTKNYDNIQEYYTNKWYTITIELDFTGDENKFSAWIGDEKVADGVLPFGALSTADYIKSIGFEMSWGATGSTSKPTVYYDNFQVWTDMGTTEDLTETDDADYGKAVKLVSEQYNEYAVLNPSLTDSEFKLSAPDEDKAIEFAQAKAEVDVKLTCENSNAGVGVYYADSEGNGKYVELVGLSEYAAGWHNVVMYVDAANKKYTAYVDGAIKHDNVDIPDNVIAPRSLFVRCKATTVYADNIKYSVPEFYDPFGNGLGETIGVQKITDPGFETLSIVTDSSNGKASISNESDKEIESDNKGTYSIVSAAEANLNDASTYGKVLRQAGASGEVEAGDTSIAVTTAHGGKPTKAIMQADVYVDTKPSDYIGFDVFTSDNVSVPTIRFNRLNGDIMAYMKDAEGSDVSKNVGTYYTKKWYTVTVEVDTVNDKYSAWINGKQVVDNATPYGKLAEATQIKQMQLRMAWKAENVTEAPVVYYDNYKVYVADESGNLAVTGIEGSKFVETRQGENKYSLAYVLDGATSNEGTLIAAVYNASKDLARIAFDNTDTDLASSDKKLLLTNFEKTAEETLRKMLWQNFDTIKPIILAQ